VAEATTDRAMQQMSPAADPSQNPNTRKQ